MSRKTDAVHVCSFTSLDAVPKKKHGDKEAVYAALRRAGRYSCFEMNGTLWGSIEQLVSEGRITLDGTTPYPWTNVRFPDQQDTST